MSITESSRASTLAISFQGVQRSLGSFFIPPIGLILGQYDPAKTGTVDYTPVRVFSSDDVGSKFGFGSHAHRQAMKLPSAVFLQGGGIYIAPLPEAESAVVADETVTFTGTATSSGTLYFSIGGDLIQVGVTSGDAFGAVATALATAITAERDIAVTAIASDGVVAVTAKFKGTAGNQILIKVNPSGSTQENLNPAGITTTLENDDGYLDAGATDPSVELVFFDSSGNDILGDRWYTAVTMPFTDQTNIDFHKASADARADSVVNRIMGNHGAYTKETFTEALALPASTNSEYISEIWENRNESPSFELSANLVGIILDEQNAAPNRPCKTVELDIEVDSDIANRRYDENDALFRAGMSYCNISSSGVASLGDLALTYRTNSLGGSTEEWYDVQSLSTRQAKAYSMEQLFKRAPYDRAVVVDNFSPTAVEYAVAPKDIIADITKLIDELWVPFAWTKNRDEVVESITAGINAGNNGRIDASLIDDGAMALRIITANIKFLY